MNETESHCVTFFNILFEIQLKQQDRKRRHVEKHSRGIDQDRILCAAAGDQEIPMAEKSVRRCKLNNDGHKCLAMD